MTKDIKAEKEHKKILRQLKNALEGTIKVIASTVEAKDPYTAGHQRRVTRLADSISKLMRTSKDQREGIHMAGIVHDIGKISIPAEILTKPTRLNGAEFALIKTHPQIGFDILKQIEFPWPVAEIVYQHHERIDGSGYPQGLSGEEILLEAKILALADIIEAMSSHRPYRPALGIEAALNEILDNKGVLYDSQVVDACMKLFKEERFKLDDENQMYES